MSGVLHAAIERPLGKLVSQVTHWLCPSCGNNDSENSQICQQLNEELARWDDFGVKAQAAAAAYSPPGERAPPAGYRNATDDDLNQLGLSRSKLEHPVDPATNKATNFRAAVFVNNTTNAPLIAFKGTSPMNGEDWSTNINQGLGRDTFYYRQAQYVANRASSTDMGKDVTFTGHSLGGGMAAAAAQASGRPAVTFNAAGLNARTVPYPEDTDIDDVYVKGEILHSLQKIPGIPSAFASGNDRHYGIDPADVLPWQKGSNLQKTTTLLSPVLRAGALHMMGNVQPAIAQKISDLKSDKEMNGCP